MKLFKKIVILISLLTQHYNYPNYLTSSKHGSKLYQLMQDTHQVFEHNKLIYWAHAGTLLGAIRHDGIIPWDDDLDIIIREEDMEKLKTTFPIFKELGYEVSEISFGYKIFKNDEFHTCLDIMIFIETQAGYKYNPRFIKDENWQKICFKKDQVFPIKQIKFGPTVINIPNDSISYLNSSYPDWQTKIEIYNHTLSLNHIPVSPITKDLLYPLNTDIELCDNTEKIKNLSKKQMDPDSKIFIAGHNGLVGSAIIRNLKACGYTNIITISSKDLDLRNQEKVNHFFDTNKFDYVFLAAAKVGGIGANNTYPADFIYDNLMIETNIIKAAHDTKVKKLLFLGSSCIYPKMAKQPIKEEYLLDGQLEKTNEPYAIAKIAGIVLCQSFKRQFNDNFICCMPTNLFGINDNFNLANSHVLPALMRKIHEAKINNQPTVELWGTGAALREFLYADDLAEACVFLMNNYDEQEIVNIGTGTDISIKDLANLIKSIVGYDGEIVFNTSMPDGTPKKLLNVEKINQLGWSAKTDLKTGIQITYNWFLENNSTIKK